MPGRRPSPTTLETYRRDLQKYVLPRFGAHRLGRIPPEEVENWLNDEIDADIAPSSVHRHYRTLRRMLQVAVDKQEILTNPCARVQPPRVLKREMAFLSWQEVAALANAHNGQWLRKEPKTPASIRSITVPQFTANLLSSHLHLDSLPGPDGLVLPNAAGNPLVNSSVWNNHFRPALGKAHVQCCVHDLRHTSVALAIAAGRSSGMSSRVSQVASCDGVSTPVRRFSTNTATTSSRPAAEALPTAW